MFSNDLQLKAFRALRIFKSLRVLKVIRILRQLEYMLVIAKSIEMCYYNFINISTFITVALLMIIFIFVFTLLGLQIFGGNTYGDPRQNWNSVDNSFINTFQIMTL